MTIHSGGCHCGRVQFEVEAPPHLVVSICNCSICEMSGYQHLIVTRADFRLLHGDDALTTYRFRSGVARHMFCKHCGIKSFYVPRSHPDGISVNVRCLKKDTIAAMEFEAFDGVNWEQNAGLLRPLGG